MFFYRESVDVDYSMDIQQKSGVTLCLNSYGGEIETFAHSIKPEQPGVNGLRFAKTTSFLYYTSTVLKLFMRVRVDRQTLAPLGVLEYLGGDKMMDDFLLDEEAGVAYVTTHRENTIDRMSLEPDRNEERESVAGNPFDAELVGPSSGAWGRAPGEAGRVAYFTTDGGTTALPPDGVLRAAKILRVEF
jgi:hypothetical protein